MSNLDDQPGREDRAGFTNRPPNNRAGLDDRRTGMNRGTIGAVIAAIVVVGALMLFGPWGHNRTADNTTIPAARNSTTGTTTGQTSPTTPAPTTPAPATPAPATTR
jgi:hypothetical protein